MEDLLEVPHWGFRDGERPRYGPCPDGCERTLRVDRLDLMEEHRASCSAIVGCVDCDRPVEVVLQLLGSARCQACRTAGPWSTPRSRR